MRGGSLEALKDHAELARLARGVVHGCRALRGVDRSGIIISDCKLPYRIVTVVFGLVESVGITEGHGGGSLEGHWGLRLEEMEGRRGP